RLLERLAVVADAWVHVTGAGGAEALAGGGLGPVLDRVAREHRPLERRDRPGDLVARRQRTEDGLERGDILAGVAQPLDRPLPGVAVAVEHLQGVLHRPLRLIFERGGAAVPELEGVVAAVEHGRGAHAALVAADAGAEVGLVGEALPGVVAGGAGDGL